MLSQDFSHDDLRETQLLFGERVEPLKEQDGWLFVYTPEQGLFGWLPKECLCQTAPSPHVVCSFDEELPFGSFGSGRPIPPTFSRSQLVEDALQFLGAPYLWGGRSSYRLGPIGSVDCSGLVNILYRAQGILIPRDAAPQKLFGKPTTHLLPGDPLYLDHSHVILKLEGDFFIEAPETGKSVRLLRWNQDIWEDEGKICIFDRTKRYSKHPRCFI